jgi:hypothetical protein
MSKPWYIAPEHFRIQAGIKTKQAKFRIRSLVAAQGLLDKKYVREMSSRQTEKKKSEVGN